MEKISENEHAIVRKIVRRQYRNQQVVSSKRSKEGK